MPTPAFRYERLGYVALNVSDLARSRTFYRDVVGLEEAPGGGPDTAFLRCSHSHHDVMLTKGEPGLKRVSWRMESPADLAAVRARLAILGLIVTPVDAMEARGLGFVEGVRFTEPTTGATIEFTSGGVDEGDFASTHTSIARLGHVVLRSATPKESEAFLLDELNFRVSDRIDGAVTFMRCFPNPFHHSMGISASDKPGLHHVNFMVTEIDDVGRAIHRFRRENVPIVYGPGRHPPSDSVFLYFLDPDGMTLEYSYGMEEFAELDPREPRTLPMSLASIDCWGAVPAPDMAKVGALEMLDAQSAAQ
jgi:2,3-dihydroxy-p-cumate/2,3-dihydroxybenzoate 3,4-dioxygenase